MTKVEISRLEQAWLKAEALADEAKTAALQAGQQLETIKKKIAKSGGEEISVLLSSVEAAKARHMEAEQMACAAFDRLWQAQAAGQPVMTVPALPDHVQGQMNA